MARAKAMAMHETIPTEILNISPQSVKIKGLKKIGIYSRCVYCCRVATINTSLRVVLLFQVLWVF